MNPVSLPRACALGNEDDPMVIGNCKSSIA